MTDKPEFEIGQEVTVRRNLGVSNSRTKGRYYHGLTIRKIPLGTKGIVTEVYSENLIVLKLANGDRICAHPGELYSKEELNEMRKPDESKVASLLEKSLGEDKSWRAPEMPRIEGGIDSYFVSRVNGQIIVTRYEDGKQKIYSQDMHKFDPQFNVREEFVLWMNQEFPDFEKHIISGHTYKALEERQNEVYGAAVKACMHGINTTQTCMQGAFRDHLSYLTRNVGTIRFNFGLSLLINTIVNASANLNDENSRHYGTSIRVRR